MRVLLDLVTIVTVAAGALFFLAGTVGLLRFPDSLSRLHALTKADNLGLGLVVLGLFPQTEGLSAMLKLVVGMAAGPIGGRDGDPACCPRNPARRSACMTAEQVFDGALALLVLGVAVWTVAAGPAFAAVVGFVASGCCWRLVWVRIAAVDVALTEAAVGSGVTGAFSLPRPHAFALRSNERQRNGPASLCVYVAAVLAIIVAAGLAALVLFPAEPAPTLAPAAAAYLHVLDVGNPVTAVLLAYRSLDTLLEKVVLLLALMGVWSLAPDRFWGGAPGSWPGGQQGGELTLLARLLPPIGIVIGVYILWVGAIAPGGAFQGGAILAAMWLLVMIAGLREAPEIGQWRLRLILVAGPAVFLAVGLAGFALPGGFLSYPEQFAKPLIIAIEVVLTLSIAAILGLLVAGPPESERQR